MPIHRVRKKIHHLRRQPEDVRLRAASYVTVVGGVLLTILWVTVLLPMQLRLSGGLNTDDIYEDSTFQNIGREGNDTGQVGGIRDEAPSPRPQLFYTAPPQVDPRGSVVNEYTVYSNENAATRLPEEKSISPSEPERDENPEAVPVEMTE